MKKIRNVIIINDFDYVQGGASKVAIDTAKLLTKEGLNVYFFSAVSKNEEKNDDINYVSTFQNEALKEKNKIIGFINGIYNFKSKKELKKLLKNFDKNDTIVHIHSWTKALSCSVFDIANKMDFKVVLTLHDYFSACPNGGFYNYKKNVICKLKPLSLKCIKCNCDSRNYFFKIYRVFRQFVQNKVVKMNKKIRYLIGISDLIINVLKSNFSNNAIIKKIYNPIEFNEKEKKVNWKNNKYYLYVGRVSQEKGIDIFCKAITELGLNGIVVGDGSEKEKLEKKYKNINFVGWKNSNEVKKYICKARCLIFPSMWYEGAPLTPLESISLGVPYLISNNCAGREYIRDFVYNNYEELLQKIKQDEFKIDYTILKKFKSEIYTECLINYYNRSINEG